MFKKFILISSLALFGACGPSVSSGDEPDAGGETGPCTGDETRCSGNIFQACVDGEFQDQAGCSNICDPGLGCIDCNPQFDQVCSGNDVVTCNGDGSYGGVIETCAADTCSGGSCSTDCASDGSDLVYVVDETYRLLSFDPRKIDTPEDPFTLLGNIDCPAGPAWPEWGGGRTPFSMSVDRDTNAWVLYTSGEIFRVSPETLACEQSGFAPGQSNFKLFGMGFVSDAQGSSSETLWIAGGPVDASGVGDLGSVNPASLTVSRVGSLPSGAEFSPELTGTGAGELFGYYPGVFSSSVARIDKSSGGHAQQWSLPGLGGDISAWAFAHWGGQFYIFVTTGFGTDTRVKRFDPATGGVSDIITNVPYVIVGAGVSTCAPIVVE
jgi:hypothetical protein